MLFRVSVTQKADFIWDSADITDKALSLEEAEYAVRSSISCGDLICDWKRFDVHLTPVNDDQVKKFLEDSYA